jgi:uncharacterized protein YktB (UPF0637 family)
MFTDKEFEVFEIPGFDARMPRIREAITPRLRELGNQIAPILEAESGLRMSPQVAMHLRRTVNPPEETWVSFCREARGYKPYVHLRLAVNLHGVKYTCYLEEDADDKPAFARNLRKNARAIAAHLKEHPEIRSHHAEANYGKMLPGLSLKESALRELADRLDRVKSQHANFSIAVPRDSITGKAQGAPVESSIEKLQMLIPLYRLGLA